MLQKTILMLITFFILNGCTGAPVINMTRPDGGPTPDPYYVLRTTGREHPIQISFYHAAVHKVEDLDGSKQPSVSYLERRKEYYFSKDKYPDLHTVLRVVNPTNLQYKVYTYLDAKFSNGGQMTSYSEVAHSDMKYREVMCPLPLVEGMSNARHEVTLVDMEGNVLLRTGQFIYNFN